MNKIHLIPIVLTGTSCLAKIENGEFAINLTDNDIKENFEKTFDTLKGICVSILSIPKKGKLKNNNSVYFSIEKDKIKLRDIDDNNNDKYSFYSYYIENYVTLKEKVYGSYNLMYNTHEINDIKTCKVDFNIPKEYIEKYKDLEGKIKILKEKLFNNKDYGFLIFNDAYSEYIKENHRSFNIELKDGNFIITANKEYLEKYGTKTEYEYYIKVFIDSKKTKDHVVNDKYKDYDLEKVRVFTYSLGKKKSAEELIEAFKKYEYSFNIDGYKLCDKNGKEITGKNLNTGTYYVKNDIFFTEKTIIELYDKFLKDFNENLVNGVEELIDKESISEEDFKNKMTAINEFFEKFSDANKEKDKKYESLFKDINYGKIIDKKFEYLNELRRKLMAMYMYKKVIIEVNGIINKLENKDFSGLNIDDFFNDDYSKLKDYSNNFIHKIYENFEEDFIEVFSVNKEFYYNDVTKQDYNAHEKICVGAEISNLIGHKEYDNYIYLQKNLEKLLAENKDNLFENIYTIDTDITELKESDTKILKNLIKKINDSINKKILYRKQNEKLSYNSLLNNLNLYDLFYKNEGRCALFFDIFVDGKQIVFDYNKNWDELSKECLPKEKHTILIKFYDCVKLYGLSETKDDSFYKLLIAQIVRKDYEEKEIEKIKKITSLAELNTKYKKILDKKGKYDFSKEIKCIGESDICNVKYWHSGDENCITENCITFTQLPNIYKTLVAKLQQLEIAEMDENAKEGVKEIGDKYKGLVDIITQKINSTETLEKLNKLPYSKKEDIRKHLEDKVKSEVADYNNKKSKIPNFDIFVNEYVDQVYNAYNTKSSGIIKDEQEKKIKAAEDEEKRKKEEEDKENKDEEDKKKKNTEENKVQTSTEGNGSKPEKSTKKQCCNCNKSNK